MPKLINCPSCHKSISADADVCPSCGRSVTADPRLDQPLTFWGIIGLGALGVGIVGAGLALILSGGHVQRTEVLATAHAGWAPHLGESVLLKADAVSCPKNELFDALHGKLAALRAKAIKQGVRTTGPQAGLGGCVLHPAPAGNVKVLKLSVTELGLPVAQVRGASGATFWVHRGSLAQLHPQEHSKVSAGASSAKIQPTAPDRSLRMQTHGQRAD